MGERTALYTLLSYRGWFTAPPFFRVRPAEIAVRRLRRSLTRCAPSTVKSRAAEAFVRLSWRAWFNNRGIPGHNTRANALLWSGGRSPGQNNHYGDAISSKAVQTQSAVRRTAVATYRNTVFTSGLGSTDLNLKNLTQSPCSTRAAVRRRCGESRPSLHWKGLLFITRQS